ncbi:MAG: hypothetical protein J2P52_07700 [Blastocatellia bacterium]|nr:hypothetical protein [Blastocatellia bacterium]
MNPVRSSPQFVKQMGGRTQPSGSGPGYLLVAVMAIFLIATNTYGFYQATGLPPLIGLTVAILAFVIRMYMIRRRSPYERVTSDGLERALFYLPAAILSTGLSAFAIYCLVVDSDATPKRRPSRERLEHATVVIENYYHDIRAKIRSRLETIDERLRDLNNQPTSERSQMEIADLKEEQRIMRGLFRRTTTAVRPLASDDGGGSDDEDSVPETLSRKFDEAAKLHQQLPDIISRDVEAPMLESLPEDTTSGGKFERFFRNMMALSNEAIGCLVVPIILEIFIVILVISNRPRD